MVSTIKESYKVIIVSAFLAALFMLGGDAIYSGVVKNNKSASVQYVDDKHEKAKAYTDEEILKHANTEAAYREGTQNQLNDIKEDTKLIKEWVINQK